jgi:peroxiredoxin Q/BCP
MRLQAGDRAPPFEVRDIAGRLHSLDAYRGRPLLLQFYRYAGCPMCDLRMHDFAHEYSTLEALGVRAIAFFHSPAERLRKHLSNRALPFPVVADPLMATYRAFGVESSILRLFWSTVLPSFYVDWMRAMRHGFWGSMNQHMTTMPADFLIDANQIIQRVHYGADIGDHMPVQAIMKELKPSQRPGESA